MEDMNDVATVFAGGITWINPKVLRDVLEFPGMEGISAVELKEVILEIIKQMERETELQIAYSAMEE